MFPTAALRPDSNPSCGCQLLGSHVPSLPKTTSALSSLCLPHLPNDHMNKGFPPGLDIMVKNCWPELKTALINVTNPFLALLVFWLCHIYSNELQRVNTDCVKCCSFLLVLNLLISNFIECLFVIVLEAAESRFIILCRQYEDN